MRTYALLGLALVVAVAVSYVAGALGERARHTATAKVLVGTVVMSKEGSRWIIFYPDGAVRPQNSDEFRYLVLADGWVDGSGTIHDDGTYPTCLVVPFAENAPIYATSARVELTTVDWDSGASEPVHVAVRVHCLN
jgi:hypothetical protein